MDKMHKCMQIVFHSKNVLTQRNIDRMSIICNYLEELSLLSVSPLDTSTKVFVHRNCIIGSLEHDDPKYDHLWPVFVT